MSSFNDLLAQGTTTGTTTAWFFIPSAILLGALHGLEPGHSKTMMAAFIIAVRGTLWQAVLLGLSAAFSHSALIWIMAAIALKYGAAWNAETTEPYFQIASGVIIIALAAWMFWRLRRTHQKAAHHHHHDEHEHSHHEHAHEQDLLTEVLDEENEDAHARAHAADIARRFTNRHVTTGQIVLFGLTGGLLPCPAAFTILLICLQLKRFVLGFTLVACFSFGLALTLVTIGVAAAWGVHHASRHVTGFHRWAQKAPYLSSGLLTLVGGFILYQGIHHLFLVLFY